MNTDKKNTQLPQSSVKSRFFAQYWGQKVMKKNIEGLENFYSEPDGFIRSMTKDSPLFLELKPLSKITDEDVISMYRGLERNYESANQFLEDYKSIGFLEQSEVDFLRSKGYAVPFMEYSVDDLISFGWVRLL